MKVEINHLTKVIQGNVVLDDINACFSCASGENGGRIYGIQGINGSGKTMLMRVICGLVLPTMGTVSIDGEIICISYWTPPPLMYLHICSMICFAVSKSVLLTFPLALAMWASWFRLLPRAAIWRDIFM